VVSGGEGNRKPECFRPSRGHLLGACMLLGALLAGGCARDLPLAPRAEVPVSSLDIPLGADSALFFLHNRGEEPLVWEPLPLAFPTLVTFHPAGATIPPRDSMSVVVRVDKEYMPMGLHTFQVRIRTNGFQDPVLTLTVDVPPHPRVSAAAGTVPFPEQGGTFLIRNSGTGVLHWEAESQDSWLIVEQTSGALEGSGTPGQQVPFSIDRDQVPTDRVAEIVVTSNAAGGPVTVEILVRGNPPPIPVYPGAEHFEGSYFLRGTDLLWPGDEVSLPAPPFRMIYPVGHPPEGVVLHEAVFLLDPPPGIWIEPEYTIQHAAPYRDGVFLIPRDHPTARLNWYFPDEETTTTYDFPLPPLKTVRSPANNRLLVSTENRLVLLRESLVQGEGWVWTVADQIESVPFADGDGRFYLIEGEGRDLILTSGGYAASFVHGAAELDPGGPMETTAGSGISRLLNLSVFGLDSIRVVGIPEDDPDDRGFWTFPRGQPLGAGVRYLPPPWDLDG
jgi:hypothetical protein